ncbi:M61 family metallopeptidase [Oculatella sp. LEGE 06141]|uniref:M61 family metallopeptidase n=1 Tax=Oculatella sp. LEGE 06141 TaxID=1828648 RepID=UPI00187F2DE7|nr:M61 family metallopeptidase [Oculatella sp. LEGE 06141]MBE9178006.1 M61 family metallopeptidase [Oculatella sp. LEGE 06141]
MTEATKTRPSSTTETNLEIHYRVAMPQPESHLFEVTLQVAGWQADVLDLKMPVWTPGSYLIREYARHLQDFSATANQSLNWKKCSKHHWQVETAGQSELTIRYRIFANELTVRTNHLDATHGYFNGAALFFYLPGFEHLPVRVTIAPPQPDWQISTALPAVPDQAHTFTAADFDTLVDSPFEVGIHQRYDFEVLGKPHQFGIWGRGNAVPEQIINDTCRIIEAEAQMFGGLPYDRYLFLLHLSSQGFGGLEHKNSCTLNYSRLGFRSQEKYHRFMQLVAHEFFHLWNVKRIRPKALEVFDYEQENYTPSLWFSEGTTSYYDILFPLRAGIYDVQTVLRAMGKEISRFLTTPGRRIQPLSESSFDAWIKLYRRDANSDNSQMSYYLKGEMVSLLLDLLIRARHHNARSLDDVMRQMWEQFGHNEVGFTPEQLQQVIETVAETDLTDFFHRYLDTVEDLPFNQYLEPFGLQLQAHQREDLPPFIGINVKREQGRELIKFVEYASPAQHAGIDAGDELLAIDGLRVTAEQLSDRLKDFQVGETVQLTVFHQDELKTCSVMLAEPQSTSYHLISVANPSAVQQQNFEGWLGVPLAALESR